MITQKALPTERLSFCAAGTGAGEGVRGGARTGAQVRMQTMVGRGVPSPSGAFGHVESGAVLRAFGHAVSGTVLRAFGHKVGHITRQRAQAITMPRKEENSETGIA